MAELVERKCEACRAGAPRVTAEEKRQLLPQIRDWEIVEQDGIERLVRTYRVDGFKNALLFTMKIGELAEAEGHHPAILTEWGRVTVSWWSHKIKGLHVNDFIMAAKTERIARL